MPPIHMPFFLGGGDLVADAFAGDFPLELGEGKKDIQAKQTPKRAQATKRERDQFDGVHAALRFSPRGTYAAPRG